MNVLCGFERVVKVASIIVAMLLGSQIASGSHVSQ